MVLNSTKSMFAITCMSCQYTGGEDEWEFFPFEKACEEHGEHEMVNIMCPACNAESEIESRFPFNYDESVDEEDEEEEDGTLGG